MGGLLDSTLGFEIDEGLAKDNGSQEPGIKPLSESPARSSLSYHFTPVHGLRLHVLKLNNFIYNDTG